MSGGAIRPCGAAGKGLGLQLELGIEALVGRLVEQALHLGVGLFGATQDAADQRVHRRVELGERHHLVGHAQAQRLGGVEALGHQEQLEGLVAPDDARQEPRHAAVARQGDAAVGGGEVGRVGRQHHVAAQRQRQAEAGAGTVHAADHRHPQAGQCLDAAVDVLLDGGAEAGDATLGRQVQLAGEILQVAAGHEMLAGALDDDHPQVVPMGEL